MANIEPDLIEQIADAAAEKRALDIRGGNSKAFYGRIASGEPLQVSEHNGITSYEPTELVITARAGTSLEEIEYTLEKNNQMLPFEPPHFGPTATLGGTIACNLSGPRRAYQGAARDYVLGTRIINGRAEALQFGGEVMKNVAGYDVSRLMTGAMGTLGVLLDISLKVLPRPASEVTLVQEMECNRAVMQMNQWAGLPLPVSATAWFDGLLYVRLAGAASAVVAASKQIGGSQLEDADHFWRTLREHQHPFFTSAKTLWRLSVSATAKPIPLAGQRLIEWGGGLRWLASDENPQHIFEATAAENGHAIMFRGGDRDQNVFQPLNATLSRLHHNMKQAFDPHNIFNPGRMYQDI